MRSSRRVRKSRRLSRPGRSDRPLSDGRGSGRDDRDAAGRPQLQTISDRDVLAMREQGRSFAGIARTTGMKRAADAREAFLRELRSRPEEERQGLVSRELDRLDKLEVRVRAHDTEEPDKLQTRLAALATMRANLA